MFHDNTIRKFEGLREDSNLIFDALGSDPYSFGPNDFNYSQPTI
jgi:hypothetical protein